MSAPKKFCSTMPVPLKGPLARPVFPSLIKEWKGMPHVFPFFHTILPEAKQALLDMARLCRQGDQTIAPSFLLHSPQVSAPHESGRFVTIRLIFQPNQSLIKCPNGLALSSPCSHANCFFCLCAPQSSRMIWLNCKSTRHKPVCYVLQTRFFSNLLVYWIRKPVARDLPRALKTHEGRDQRTPLDVLSHAQRLAVALSTQSLRSFAAHGAPAPAPFVTIRSWMFSWFLSPFSGGAHPTKKAPFSKFCLPILGPLRASSNNSSPFFCMAGRHW
jgi:hypothetical protein